MLHSGWGQRKVGKTFANNRFNPDPYRAAYNKAMRESKVKRHSDFESQRYRARENLENPKYLRKSGRSSAFRTHQSRPLHKQHSEPVILKAPNDNNFPNMEALKQKTKVNNLFSQMSKESSEGVQTKLVFKNLTPLLRKNRHRNETTQLFTSRKASDELPQSHYNYIGTKKSN